jgi:hypothetical protein
LPAVNVALFQNHHIVKTAFNGGQTVQTVGKVIHLVFFKPQKLTQSLRHSFFVFDQQKTHTLTSYQTHYITKD